MAKKKVQAREYNFSDATLKQMADGTLQNIGRDNVEFGKKGFTETKKQSLLDDIELFAKLPTDENLEGKQIDKTDEKDAARGTVETSIRTIMTMAENKYTVDSGKYKQFGSPALSRMNDNQLVRAARNVVATGRELLDELEDEGLTNAILDELEAKNILFDKAIDTQLKSIKDRDIATETRIVSGNKIYNELKRLCNTGKDIWYTENEAKYNDYIIYDNTAAAKEAPPSVETGQTTSEPVAQDLK